MRRIGLLAVVGLGLTLAPTAASSQGIYEYWKAGTKRGPSRSALAHGHARAGQTSAPAPSASASTVVPWTSGWFSDSMLVGRGVGEMVEALTVPMIGQSFPLPRGGGFVCTRLDESSPPAAGGLTCVIECVGPELGGRRHNWFYAGGENGTPALDHVRWLILAPSASPRGSWRAFVHAVADSLAPAMGRPAWSVPDSLEVGWTCRDYATTMRLHATATRVDSLEIECVSNRLAAAHVAGR